MAAKSKPADSLTKLLDASTRPIYAVNALRKIVYCNVALADWLGIEWKRIIGREVEYHSEPEVHSEGAETLGPLAALCPPPRALEGAACTGTVSCVARDGRLVHRRAEFIPLATAGGGVFVLLAAADMPPHELAAEISAEPTGDELHRTIRRFRRAQAAHHGRASLVGESPTMQKVRAQVAAAADSGANVLIVGPPGSGRAHVARAIHYRAAAEADVSFVPVDCGLLTDDLLRRTLDGVAATSRGDARHRPTLLLENLEQLAAAHQSQLADVMRRKLVNARWISTINNSPTRAVTETRSGPTLEPNLAESLSTITIRLPRLVERLEDLPLLAHYFLEESNHGRAKQVGSVRAEALDLLALYSWPGELDELRDVIAASHRAATSAEITPRDLPIVIHHATSKAGKTRRPPERIVLDDLIANIEKELIERALAQAGGNKTEAAALLGMTRPRLYRRLVQLGLASETSVETEEQLPEFVERVAPEHEP